MTTPTSTPAGKTKIIEATSTIVNALVSFESTERKRIIAAALALLGETQSSASADSVGAATKSTNDHEHSSPQTDGEFFTKFDHDKPSDNALLVAAYHYSRHGSAPFSAEEMRKIAESEAGLTVPARLDMTYAAAQRNGKTLFARAERGQFKPTVYGEKFFRETYHVSKGNMKKLEATAKE